MQRRYLGLLVMSALAVANIASAAEYSCRGVRGTTGELELSIHAGKLGVSGSFASNREEGTSLSCNASRLQRGGNPNGRANYSYYETHGNCSVDYVRVSRRLLATGRGLISLVNRDGQDTDHWSGYVYRDFFCFMQEEE